MAKVEEKFHEPIMNLLDNNRSSYNSIFTRERYAETISNVKEAKYHKDTSPKVFVEKI